MVQHRIAVRQHPFNNNQRMLYVIVLIDEVLRHPPVLPIPVPIYVPVPVHTSTTPYPVPVPFPVPIPVPIFIPTSQKTYKGVLTHMKVSFVCF